MSESPAKRRRASSRSSSSPKRRRADGDIIDLTDSGVEDWFLEEELELDETIALCSNEIPVRRLDLFSLSENRNAVPAMDLLGYLAPKRYTARGLVRVQSARDEDDDDDDEYGQFVEGLEVLELNIHHISGDEFDEKIYILTPRAWYILQNPSEEYRPFFNPLWVRQQLAHGAMSSALAKTAYDSFANGLRPPLYEWQLKTSAFHDYLKFTLIALEVHDLGLNKSPLIKKILSQPQTNTGLDINITDDSKNAFVTPAVARAITPHLNSRMTIVGADSEGDNDDSEDEFDPAIEHVIPERMEWGSPLSTGRYSSIHMDGIEYKTGDIVSVNPGEDEDIERADSAKTFRKYCLNNYAKRVWFCRIEYFFDDKVHRDASGEPMKKFHCVWFDHGRGLPVYDILSLFVSGSRALLQQVTHQQELFMLRECSSIPVSSINRRCDVRKLGHRESEPKQSEDSYCTSYFYRFIWDPNEYSFTDIPDNESLQQLRGRDPRSPCMNCGLIDEEGLRTTVVPIDDGFSYFGVNYHLGEFVYIRPNEEAAERRLEIGQIVGINFEPPSESEGQISCTIRYYDRLKLETAPHNDERRLYRTRHTNLVSEKDLDGVCFVKFIPQTDTAAINAWITMGGSTDRFYTCTREIREEMTAMDEDGFNEKQCQICFERHIEDWDLYSLNNPPLAALDVFSGAGGLSAGMELTGFVESRWAIEHSACAAQTFAANHPNAIVIHGDVNDVLKTLVERDQGNIPHPLRLSDGTFMPERNLPRPGEIDIIMGGPPCQSFSGANYFKEDDIRSTLPYTMLSLVEMLSPTYVLLENVPGFLRHKFTSPKGQIIDMAALKLTFRGLLALNYQAVFKILQAGEYGAAQDRQRVIILATRLGTKMPSFPSPTHAFSNPPQLHKVPIRRSDRIRPPTRSSGDIESTTYAVHPAVTVNDVIGDLPAFDWINPHRLVPGTLKNRQTQRKREKKGILQVQVMKGMPVGFPDGTFFSVPPQTRMQQMLRRPDNFVEHHVTESFSEQVVEVTTMIPMRPWSNHLFVPKEVLPRRLKDAKDVYYSRLDPEGSFKTALTCPKPYTKKSNFLHPTQKRALTFREFARSQGFPDGYVFLSTKDTPSRKLQDYFQMVGNAVPLPLAMALGRSIGSSLVEEWRRCSKPANEEEVV
ncbi:S-adenosyl-L-methionine-dependent methyltransferase [Mycena amicta]|nr:S-adenosyl-L-methionine-dependent methyltransferase [Mycena amicta]